MAAVQLLATDGGLLGTAVLPSGVTLLCAIDRLRPDQRGGYAVSDPGGAGGQPSPVPPTPLPDNNSGSSHRIPIIAAAITGAATIAAAVIATVVAYDSPSRSVPDQAAAAPTEVAISSPSASSQGDSSTSEAWPIQSLAPEEPEAPSTEPVLVIEPDRARWGSKITVSGMGFQPGERVRISVGGAQYFPKELRDVGTDDDGSFTAEVRIPADQPCDDGDENKFEAEGLNSHREADTPFTCIR